MTVDTPRTSLWWSGLHLLMALSLPLLLVVLVGCKKAKAKREDLGPEISSETINEALSKAAEGASITTLAKGQNVRYSHTRRIENEETVIDMGERRVEVIDRQDTKTEARFTMRIVDKERLDNGDYRTVITEDSQWVDKLTTGSLLPAGHVQALGVQASSGKAGKITFHHLFEEDAIVDPPLAMKLRADCGGLSPCQLRVHYLQFDMALWEDDTNYQKITFDFAYSLDTPFLPFGEYFELLNGVLITDCRSTFVPLQSRTVYVRDCYSLEDFKK